MLRLTVRCEKDSRAFEIPAEEALLGSSATADLRAPFRGISRRHAHVRPHERGVAIRDAGSKNGLVRDGKRYSEIVLQPGDWVQLGQATLALEEISTGDADLSLRVPRAANGAAAEEPTTPRTASLLEASDGPSPSNALQWARQHLPGAPSLEASDLESARRAMGARAILFLRLADGATEGAGIVRYAGELPAPAELEELAAAGSVRGTTPSRSRSAAGVVSLAAGFALVRRDANEPSPFLLAALLPLESSKPKAWQVDFFDYFADVALPGGVARNPDSAFGSRRASPAQTELIFPPEFVAGDSAAMRGLLGQVRATVVSQLDVLLLGETGTGKELFARMIHASGPRAKGPFVAINCAAIPAELLEAQLFGVEGRIATGVDPRAGLFVKAEGGSIFLDEIGELPSALQAKLLRVIQEREVLAVGAHAPRKIHLRVISASNKDLERDVRHGRFRADLYYRLRGLQFHLPPLRDRREDIPSLVARFVAHSSAEHGKRIAGVSRKALELLQGYDWPGNVRELRIEIDRAVLVADDGSSLTSQHFAGVRWHLEHRGKESGEIVLPPMPSILTEPPPPGTAGPYDLGAARDGLERRLIEEALVRTGGNQSRAAKLLGITRNGLALKLKRLGITAERG